VNHSEIRSQMPDYLEGDLPLDRRALFDAHLDECRECAREISEMRWTIGALRALPEPTAPARMADDVMRRIRTGEGRTTLADRLRGVGAALFAPRVLAPLSVAAIAAGVLIGVEPLRQVIEKGPAALGGFADDGSTPTATVQSEAVAIAGADARGPVPIARVRIPLTSEQGAAIAAAAREAAQTPGQELFALTDRLTEPSSRRTRFSDWPSAGAFPSTFGVAPSVSVATRPGAGPLGGSDLASRDPGPYLPTRVAESDERWPSAGEWLDHIEHQPVDFADQMALRTLAEQEHWIDSLSRRAVADGRLDRVVAALRSSPSSGAQVLADDFAAAGVRHGGTLSASSAATVRQD
jgi:anti-sigma factor RsiW